MIWYVLFDFGNKSEAKLVSLGPIMTTVGTSRRANAERTLAIFYKIWKKGKKEIVT
jgi:hypothetical protein